MLAAGLLLRTLANLGRIDPGFAPQRVLAVSVDLYPAGYEGPRVAGFYRDLLARLRSLPGVEDASMGSALPVMGNELVVDLSVTLEEQPGPGGTESGLQPSVRHALVGSRFFQTTRMRILRGRDFGAEDDLSGAGAVIVNETAARLLWDARDPLGRRLRLVETETPFQVIGVVADSTYGGLKEEAVSAACADRRAGSPRASRPTSRWSGCGSAAARDPRRRAPSRAGRSARTGRRPRSRRAPRRSRPTDRKRSAARRSPRGYYVPDAIAPRFFVTSLDDYVRACSARDWEGARLALQAVNHFARLRRRGLRLRWKLLWIQQPRLFRMLVALNDRLPHAARFVRNPTVTLR